jgi:hypothetical protein
MEPCRQPLAALAAAGIAAVAGAAPADTVGPALPDFRAAAAKHGAGATDPDHAGIWKAAVPPAGTTRGEFGGDDPVGLAAGVRIPADCSINWTDPDSGRRYCFSTATSLVVFLDAPGSYLARARATWERLGRPATH